MNCLTCDVPMLDYGIWPQIDRNGLMYHCWKCKVCNQFFKLRARDPKPEPAQ